MADELKPSWEGLAGSVWAVAQEADDAGDESHRRLDPVALPVEDGRLVHAHCFGRLTLGQAGIKPAGTDVVPVSD